MTENQTDRPTIDECIRNAARLLRFAEAESDLKKMERFERLGDSWVGLGFLLKETAAWE